MLKKKNTLSQESKIIAKIDDVTIDKNSGFTYVSVLLPNGERPAIGGPPPEEQVLPTEGSYKLTKLNPQSTAFTLVKDGSATIAGGQTNRIISTDRFGNFIVGPTTFTANLENIRFGMYRLNGLHASTLASTIVTPMPLLILDLPMLGTLNIFKEILKDFTGMMA